MQSDRRSPARWGPHGLNQSREPTPLPFGASRVKTLADMTPEEIAALERRYGAKVKRKMEE